MKGNRPLIAAAALALLVGIAAGAAIVLRGGASTGQTIPQDEASAGSGPFLTAATMPQGLGGRPVPLFSLLDARGGSFSRPTTTHPRIQRGVGDTGLEPVTSALSRRNRVGKHWQAPAAKGMIWRGNTVTRLPTGSDENLSVPSEGCDRIATAV